MKHSIAKSFLILSVSTVVIANDQLCPETTENLNYWRNIRQTAESVNANEFVQPLSQCLTSPNSELRDRIAYEVLTYWLRQNKLDESNILELKQRLLLGLVKGSGETEGVLAFERAFSALILSELVRDDSLNNRWSDKELNTVIEQAIIMFQSERDYRGLDAKYGWIHTIAHASDLLWRLSLHPKTSTKQQQNILNALTIQVARPNAPAYIFNEADRLARVVSAIISSKKVEPIVITSWLNQLSLPAPMVNWSEAFATPERMARLHNTKLFLRALRQDQQQSENSLIRNSIDRNLDSLP